MFNRAHTQYEVMACHTPSLRFKLVRFFFHENSSQFAFYELFSIGYCVMWRTIQRMELEVRNEDVCDGMACIKGPWVKFSRSLSSRLIHWENIPMRERDAWLHYEPANKIKQVQLHWKWNFCAYFFLFTIHWTQKWRFLISHDGEFNMEISFLGHDWLCVSLPSYEILFKVFPGKKWKRIETKEKFYGDEELSSARIFTRVKRHCLHSYYLFF